jgi:1,4-alpha-glucan branching enzyme
MGLPDLWIRMAEEKDPFRWNVGKMWFEMILRRKGEKTVAYVESHDQALVGDQTMIFRLAGSGMYTDMSSEIHNRTIDRAVAMHKMTKLLTAAAGGEGYLNFMGNEFGHPEWIDFPREDNGLSYQYCRRQWSLQDNPFLKYKRLGEFDRDMVNLLKSSGIYEQFIPDQMYYDETQKVIAFYRNGYLFAFNFHPLNNYTKISVPIYGSPDYRLVLCSDDEKYGGFGRACRTLCKPKTENGESFIDIILPSQTAIVMKAE